jgi:hypothetical protein
MTSTAPAIPASPSPTPDQAAGIASILSWLSDKTAESPFFLLSGSAGMGKTFLLASLPDSIRSRTVFTAPTNKAVRTLRETLTTPAYRPETRTIYSLLGLTLQANGEVKTLTVPEDPIDLSSYSLIVVDEASMLSTTVFLHIRTTLLSFPSLRVLFVGDPCQLPPVGEVASPIWNLSKSWPSFALSKVIRHDNQILTLATALREQIPCAAPCITLSSSFSPDSSEGVWKLPATAFEAQAKTFADSGAFLDASSVKLLAWRNITVDSWNRQIRKFLWGADSLTSPWLTGDRVIFTSPAKSLEDKPMASTDDEGVVTKVYLDLHPAYPSFQVFRIQITLDTGRIASALVLHPSHQAAYDLEVADLAAQAKALPRKWKAFWAFKEAFHSLRHAYSITAHRSQGSTYDSAMVCFSDILLNRNRKEAFQCLYVATTRPRKRLYLG